MAARGLRAALWMAIALTACTPHLDLGANKSGVTPSSESLVVAQDGYPEELDLVLSGDAAGSERDVEFRIAPMPAGISMTPKRTTATTESITLVADPTAKPAAVAGDYAVTLTAWNRVTGATSDPVALTITVAVAVKVGKMPDPMLGIDGGLQEVATTAFQPASFQTYIPNQPALAALHPPHPLVQIYEPTMLPDGEWDSGMLDDFVRTLETVSTEGPELQIFSPPLFPPALDPAGKFDFSLDAGVNLFADYCANLVRYYNQGSFSYQGRDAVNPAGASLHVTWWGILGDFNNAGLPSRVYPNVYNQAVGEMLDADTNIKISALEFTDNADQSPSDYLPGFLVAADAGGVNQRVDAVSLHMYATDLQGVPDSVLLLTVPAFGVDVATVRAMFHWKRPDLGDPPVWITQSNVNSNVPNDAGMSHGETFANDVRGTSAFYAAWAPYMFSQLGQKGAAAFTHWNYTAGHDPGNPGSSLDMQNAEVPYDPGLPPYLSYWVDLALAQTYPPGSSPNILQTTSTEVLNKATVDVLVTQSVSKKIVVMFEDIAAKDAIDAGDTGAFPRTVVVDLRAFMGTQFSASLLTIDDMTDRAAGPTSTTIPVPPTLRVSLTLKGYGVAFLTLTPTP